MTLLKKILPNKESELNKNDIKSLLDLCLKFFIIASLGNDRIINNFTLWVTDVNCYNALGKIIQEYRLIYS